MDRRGKYCGGEELDDDGSHVHPVDLQITLARQQEILRDTRDAIVSGDMTPANVAVALSRTEMHRISGGSPWSSISQLGQVFHKHRTMVQDVELLTINKHQPNRSHGASIYTPPIGNQPSDSKPVIVTPSNSKAPHQEQVLGAISGSTAGLVHQRSSTMMLDKSTANNEEEPSSTDGTNNRTMTKQRTAETRLVSNNQLPGTIDTLSGGANTLNYEPTFSSDRNIDAWTVAVSIILPKGKQVAVKLLYDTGSSDNMITEKFVETKGFAKRPILEKDVIAYETATGLFVPRHYVEIKVRDDDNEMPKFSKVTFKIATKLGGHTLLLGHKFMKKHGFRLRREKAGNDSFVLTSKRAGKAEKESQEAVAERTKQAQKHANEVKSSGSTSTGGATSREQPTGSSSRTSLSSGTNRKGA